ncbi:MAG: GntR family transcriptional regulator [Mycobacterium sp.]
MSHTLEPAARHRLVDIAYEQIRASIIDGSLAMGSRLKETHIADELQISRGPVRLAIQRLVEEGLVVERPHTSAVVREFDGSALVDIYNTRIGLERVAFALATRRKADTAPLRRWITDMQRAAETRDPIQVAKAELAFHNEVFLASANRTLTQAFRGLEGQILMALALDDAEFENLGAVADEHIELVEVIESGDEGKAMNAAHDHIVSTVAAVIERLGGDPALLLRS